MAGLSLRLRELGYRVLRTKTLEQGRAALCDVRFDMSLALIPPDLPVPDLDPAIAALRAAARARVLRFIACGMRPDASERSLLRNAGVEFALWEPFDDHTLQFQVNRALAESTPPPRRRHAVRVPTNLPVRVTSGRREKQARVYCLSAEGAYLATPRPSLPRAMIHFSLPLPSGELRLSGEVVMTNVPGNLMRRNLPAGMGVRFTGHTREATASILEFTEARARALVV
jgi:hypothetical protein